MNSNNLTPQYIHDLFIQQIHNLSVNNHLRDAITLNPIRGEL